MTVNIVHEGIESLLRSKRYDSKEALLDEAFRIMLEVKPAIRTEIAVELYKNERVSLSRAAEIAGTSIEGFKEVLESHGIKRIVRSPSKDKIKRGVELILGE